MRWEGIVQVISPCKSFNSGCNAQGRIEPFYSKFGWPAFQYFWEVSQIMHFVYISQMELDWTQTESQKSSENLDMLLYNRGGFYKELG